MNREKVKSSAFTNIGAGFCPPPLHLRNGGFHKVSFRQHSEMPRASMDDISVSSVAAASALRGYRLQDASVGPLLNLSLFRTSDNENAGSISGAVFPNNRLHIESYKAARRDSKGGLLHLSPGMLLFIAALAFGNQKGARYVYGLAIDDAPDQHRRLVRYLKRFGGVEMQRVTESLADVPARIFYGGIGTIIRGDIEEMLLRGVGMLERTNPSVPSLPKTESKAS